MNSNNSIIGGISCDVMNCVHNNGNCCCTANRIHVKHDDADPEHTCCDTFTEL